MKYRTKLYIALVCTACASSFVGLALDYQKSKNRLFQEIQSKILSVATTSAALIDQDALLDIRNEKNQGYSVVEKQLKAVLQANHRSDIQIKNLYILKTIEPNSLYFYIETPENEAATNPPGSLYTDLDAQEILDHINTPFVSEHYVCDQFGYWLSAFAPIYDAQGNFIATLGVDIGARSVLLQLHSLFIYALVALLFALIFAAFIAFFLSHVATKSLESLCKTVHQVEEGDLSTQAQSDSHDEFNELAKSLNAMIKGLKERELITDSFKRYVSPEILQRILTTHTLPVRGIGVKKVITTLFIDIRGFTTLAEKLDPNEVIDLLNSSFNAFVASIFNHSGSIDKFLGDGLMAAFGAFFDDPNQEKHAILTALDILDRLEDLNKKRELLGKPSIQIGIGIHTGEAIVGNIGSDDRIEFTSIGDPVNIASRLQEATKEFNVPILLSERSAHKVMDAFTFTSHGSIAIRGREQSIAIYSVERKKG